MSNYKTGPLVGLFDPVTNAPVGFIGLDGKEYLTGTSTAFSAAAPTAFYPNNVAITGGSINGATVGQTTPAAVKTSNLQATFTDSSGTPGNVTNNSPTGKAAFAAAGTTVVVTNSLVTAASVVQATLEAADTTLTSILRVVPAAGSFTVTGNAAATAATKFNFHVIN